MLGYPQKSHQGRVYVSPNKTTIQSGICHALFGLFLILFGVCIWFMGQDLSVADEILGGSLNRARIGISGKVDSFDTRTVTIINNFTHDISLFYQDGTSGSYLGNIPPHDDIKISASTGHVLYATEQLGMRKISSMHIRHGVDEYTAKDDSNHLNNLHIADTVSNLHLKDTVQKGKKVFSAMKDAAREGLHHAPEAVTAIKNTGMKIWGKWGKNHSRGAQAVDSKDGEFKMPKPALSHKGMIEDGMPRTNTTHDTTHDKAHIEGVQNQPDAIAPRRPFFGQFKNAFKFGASGFGAGANIQHMNSQDSIPSRIDSLHPYNIADVITPHFSVLKASSVKFKSICHKPISLYYDIGPGRPGVEMARLVFGQQTSFASFHGNRFFYVYTADPGPRIGNAVVDINTPMILLKDINENIQVIRPDEMKKITEEIEFNKKYHEETGLHWRSYYGARNKANPIIDETSYGPREKATYHIHEVKKKGDTIDILSTNGFWNCDGPSLQCQSQETLPLKLEALSTAPKIFLIKDLISEFEANHLIRSARPRMEASIVGDPSVGSHASNNVRNSNTAWLARHSSAVTETLFRRLSDVLKIDEKKLTESEAAESLQVVHYNIGQKYDSHFDWTASNRPQQRFSTLLIYLTDQPDVDAGGETAFPKAGFKVRPRKGMGVLFYNMLDDGNGDDLTMHSSVPVVHGEKYMTNLWVWDHHR
jgi:prolyl 4-hydroxylase